MKVDISYVLNKNYDYTIIGAGPSGLIISYILGLNGYKCLIVDENKEIGGCHRVIRVGDNHLFTEHSPRVISSGYLNTIKILKMMGIDFYKLFTPYNFYISSIGGKTLYELDKKDILKLFIEFIKLIFNPLHGYNISVKQYINDNNFTLETIDYIDRLCRLTDGSGIDRYTLFELLQLINQQSLYGLYQPVNPNDIILFPMIEKALYDTNNIDILTGINLEKINFNVNTITTIKLNYNTNTYDLSIKNLILAIPPKSIYKVLINSNAVNAFDNNFEKFVLDNSYNEDISITFHWDKKLDLPKIWGFPKTDWVVGFIVSSDYTMFDDNYSKTVISCCILDVDRKSTYLNKTANEVSDEDILKQEVFRQLQLSFPNLPIPSISILNPRVYRSNDKWISGDTGYIMSYNEHKFIDFQSKKYNNLFNLGTHNGKSFYHFTSFESAVTNAIYLGNKITNKQAIKISKPLELRIIIIYLIIFILFLIFLYYGYK
jgi:hypothetical protein